VATGVEKDPNQLFTSEIEITLSRSVEIACESVPSGIMQAYAFLLAREKSKAAAISLVISVMCTGFAGTVIGWDLDTSPLKRKVVPDFYGYIKNDPTSRTVLFLAIFIMTCSHVLMKTISTALVMSVSGTWISIYLGGDMIVFLLVKIIRGDLRYWFNLPNTMSLAASFIIRFCSKILTDFTMIMQLRHSFEVGGVQFSLLVVQNQVSCFVAGLVYVKYFDGDVAGIKKLKDEALFGWLLGLLCLFLFSCFAFVGWMDRKYLWTFYSMMTGPQYCVYKHKIATTDLQRVDTFSCHPTYYDGVKDTMQELIDENWDNWMTNRPEWLTDNVIAMVPDMYLQRTEVKRLEKEGGGKRRRSSAFFLGDGNQRRRQRKGVLSKFNLADEKVL